jgi:hypothetical protein
VAVESDGAETDRLVGFYDAMFARGLVSRAGMLESPEIELSIGLEG